MLGRRSVPAWFVLLIIAGLLSAGRHLDRQARRRFGIPPRRQSLTEIPVDAVDVELPGANGRTLRGWLVTAGPAVGPAVVVMHGWGASGADLLPAARLLAAGGLHALLVDARCHGRSDSDDFASMPRFAEDIESSVDWLRRHRLVDSGRVALLGHSVGAGACLLAASRDPAIRAVVSVSSLAHPGRFMQTAMAQRGVPPLLIEAALRYVERVIGYRYDEFAPVNTIARVGAPVLLVHGDADSTVPISNATELLTHSGGRAQLIVVPGASHTDIEALKSIAQPVHAFLQAALKGVTSGPPE